VDFRIAIDGHRIGSLLVGPDEQQVGLAFSGTRLLFRCVQISRRSYCRRSKADSL